MKITILNPGRILGGAGITCLAIGKTLYEYYGGWKISGNHSKSMSPKIITRLDIFIEQKRIANGQTELKGSD